MNSWLTVFVFEGRNFFVSCIGQVSFANDPVAVCTGGVRTVAGIFSLRDIYRSIGKYKILFGNKFSRNIFCGIRVCINVFL